MRREAKWVDDRPLSDMSDRRAPSEGIGSGEPPPRWTKNLPNAPTVRALVLVTALGAFAKLLRAETCAFVHAE